jgi:hypothetical protein
MEPTVRLLSHTAYPLETLYLAAVSLDNLELPYQSPEEINKLLYSPLSENLTTEQKQFILNTMRDTVVKWRSPYLREIITFAVFIHAPNKGYLDVDLFGSFIAVTGNSILVKLSLGELMWLYNKSRVKSSIYIANEILKQLEPQQPLLYRFITEKQ